jgi:hypothetical protein
LSTPAANGSNAAGVPSVSAKVAGTVPPTWPGVVMQEQYGSAGLPGV